MLSSSTVFFCSRGGEYLYRFGSGKRQAFRRGHRVPFTTGTAKLAGGDGKEVDFLRVRTSGKINIIGKDQTFGMAGTLALVASANRQVGLFPVFPFKESAGFSVAAIPIGVRMSNPQKQEGVEISGGQGANYVFAYGYLYTVTYISDSGDPKDLDQVKISEDVTPFDNPNNAAKKLAPETRTTSFKSAIPPPGTTAADAVRYRFRTARAGTAPAAREKVVNYIVDSIKKLGTGSTTDLQYFKFVDARTGATDETKPLLVLDSGFKSIYDFEKEGEKYILKITKDGFAHPTSGAKSGVIAAADSEAKKVDIK